MDLEFAEDVVVINDREWSIEELRDLQQRVLAEARAESSEMEEIYDLDDDALRRLVIGVVERGEVDVRAGTWRGIAYHLESSLED